MSFAVAAQLAGDEVRINDVANVATSFPGFMSAATAAGLALRNA
jgi:3-phosphoshikimate 1-carboxyvinyltransferase